MPQADNIVTCKICGKRIDRLYWDGYIYRKYINSKTNKTIYFCGWNCMRAWEKDHQDGRRGRKKTDGI